MSEEFKPTWQYEWYPENKKDNWKPYYVEFHKWDKDDFWTWTLFKRSFMFTKEEWEKKEDKEIFMTKEFHPWNLGGGKVAKDGVIDLSSKVFLKFLVDALNEKCARDETPSKDITEFGSTIEKRNERLDQIAKELCPTYLIKKDPTTTE